MKFKLDENLGTRGVRALEAAGYDVATVREQGLTSATDATLIGVCADEKRSLVTLDLDFANPLVFPPEEHAGVAVLRLPREPAASDLTEAVDTLVGALATGNLAGQLWIVRAGVVRIYRPEPEDDGD